MVEDLAVAGERVDTLLDARPRGLLERDQRHAVAGGRLHRVDDLAGVHLAERSGGHRGVLGERGHQAPVDVPGSGDDAVGGEGLVGQLLTPVLDVESELLERAALEEAVEAITGGQQTLGPPGCPRLLTAAQLRLMATSTQLFAIVLRHSGPLG
ncbi:hypothetical protein GCM10025883_37410 [Mobilicoccus caccae]|uniref:Uncharacterized protein n=1 Tax=Mobilicoccus caccae TaxID=1859295 RepID=A0ABQ6IVQ5_9MICO|nr:hypothetical protein GCM10025883_37410 [Mobilicoccus caccae]